jgi:chaperonin GroES
MRALNDRVIVKMANMPEKTAGGILIPKGTIKDGEAKINIGKVISCGDGMVLRTGEVVACKVKAGDVIVWEQFGGIRFEILGPRFVCVRSEDIGGILDKSEYDEGWFEDFKEDYKTPTDIGRDKFKEQMSEVVSKSDECNCELLCNECGNTQDVILKWRDEFSVDDSNLPACDKCKKPALKVSKKEVRTTGIVAGGTPKFHH